MVLERGHEILRAIAHSGETPLGAHQERATMDDNKNGNVCRGRASVVCRVSTYG